MARLSPDRDPIYVKSVVVNAVTERMLNPRKFVFLIQVEWTDDSVTSSYRGYTDFFDFQCGLIYAFPDEGGLTKDVPRTLPFIPGKKLFKRSSRRLAETRLPEINTYVESLFTMPEHVTHSERVLRFFRNNWQEDKLRGRYGEGASAGGQSQTLSLEPVVSYTVRRASPLPEQEHEGYTNPITIE